MKSPKNLKILIADDDPDDREFLRFLFDQHPDFELIGCVSSGAEVVNYFNDKNKNPDVLLIDLYMPLMSGLETIETLNTENSVGTTSMFIISSVNTAPEAFESLQIKFLEKPSTLVQLNDLPGKILDELSRRNSFKI